LIREIGVASIGHRGASEYAPENTLPALELAFELGAHAVEFDVRSSRDGVGFVIHDERVDRTTDGRGRVGDLDSRGLRDLDAGSWFSPAWVGLRIPTLDEVLGILPDGGLVNIEVKGSEWSDEEIRTVVLGPVERAGIGSRVVISSYDAELIRRVSELSDVCGTSLRVRSTRDGEVDRESLVGVCQCVNLEAKAISSRAVRQLHDMGFVVETYTINDESEMRRLVEVGVDAIFTDRPDLLARVLNSRGPVRS
jgi:glycerophosphoryl diester phosphodiesterase